MGRQSLNHLVSGAQWKLKLNSGIVSGDPFPHVRLAFFGDRASYRLVAVPVLSRYTGMEGRRMFASVHPSTGLYNGMSSSSPLRTSLTIFSTTWSMYYASDA